MTFTFTTQGLSDALAWAHREGFVVPASKQPVNRAERLKMVVVSDSVCEIHTPSSIYVFTQF